MDPLIGSALISGGSSLLGGLFGNSSAKKAAKAQMEFQERMARNAHQYEVADLRAAGLNPMLSVTGGSGAAVPSGAMAQVSNSNLGDSVSSALEAMVTRATADNVKAQTQNTQEATQTQKTQQTANLAQATASAASAKLMAQQARIAKMEGDKQEVIKKPFEIIDNLLDGITSSANQRKSEKEKYSPPDKPKTEWKYERDPKTGVERFF